MDLLGELRLQDVMWNTVEEMVNVHLEDELHVLRVRVDPFLYSFLCLMRAAVRQTCITVLIHSMPEQFFHRLANAVLDDQFLQRRHKNPTLLP